VLTLRSVSAGLPRVVVPREREDRLRELGTGDVGDGDQFEHGA
jgi:hypothetical protein